MTTGSYHPITRFYIEALEIFSKWGFEPIEGPELDNQLFNFDMLRIPKHHPARDLQDTFWIDDDNLLRTQTSNVQIRSMQTRKPPVRLISPGRVFRKEAIDASHLPLFHQMEGFVIDKNINLGHLISILTDFTKSYLNKDTKIRFRPNYYPFVEPGLDMDIYFNGRWMEILGSGMIHNEVLKNMNIDPKLFSGFAFGLGVERMVMIKYKIMDIRKFYQNDYRLLKQMK